jgi:hypothetical protein
MMGWEQRFSLSTPRISKERPRLPKRPAALSFELAMVFEDEHNDAYP